MILEVFEIYGVWVGGFSLAITLIALVLWAILIKTKNASFARRVTLLENLFESLGHGFVLFDEQENLFLANQKARQYIPLLADKNRTLNTLSDFLNYMFDNAADIDESLLKTLNKSMTGLSGEGMREIIKWGQDGLCLIETYKTAHNKNAAIIRDVSQLKREQEDFIRLSNYSFKLSEAVKAATNGIVVTRFHDDDHWVVFANDAFSKQTGTNTQDIAGKSLDFLVSNISPPEAASKIFSSLSHFTPLDTEVKTEKNEDTRWFNLKITPIVDQTKKLCIWVFTETTQLKKQEAEIAQSQKLEALGTLAAGVAHDFNNILSIISGFCRIAQKHTKEEETHAHLDKINTATDRGAALTRQMLTFSRHTVVVDDITDIVQTIQEQEILLKPLLGDSITLSIKTDNIDDAFIECEPNALVQIIMNLCVNARDSMPEGGNLSISLEKLEHRNQPQSIRKNNDSKTPLFRLSITDTGRGMNEATLKKMFDPFFTTKEQGKGTGLGLSIIYGLVRQMDGFCDVESKINEGTTVSIFLPTTNKRPSQKHIKGSADNLDSIDLDGYTALVTEDEEDLLNIVADTLRNLGMTVLTASNGNKALMVQDEYDGTIDLLLTDVVMPELDGVRLAHMIQEESPHTKVIFMSGYPANSQMARVEIPEEACFIAKPIEYDKLAQLVFEQISGQETSGKKAVAHWKSSEGI